MYFFVITILLCIFAVSIRKRNSNMDDKELKKQLIALLAEKRLYARLLEFEFMTFDGLSKKQVNSILDEKNRTDKEIALLEKRIESL